MTDIILAFAWICILTLFKGIARSENNKHLGVKKPKKLVITAEDSDKTKEIKEEIRNVEEEISVLGKDIMAIINEI